MVLSGVKCYTYFLREAKVRSKRKDFVRSVGGRMIRYHLVLNINDIVKRGDILKKSISQRVARSRAWFEDQGEALSLAIDGPASGSALNPIFLMR